MEVRRAGGAVMATGFSSARELGKRTAGVLFFIGFGMLWVLLSSIWLRWVHPGSGMAVVVFCVLLFAWAWRFPRAWSG